MKHVLLYLLFLSLGVTSFGQMIMSAEGVTPENACNPDEVYFLMERRAHPVEAITSIQERLNETISFAKDNPEFTGTCAIQLVVNCRGEVGGGFHVVTKSGDDRLDTELIGFFKTIREWNAGMKNKKSAVDSWYMWRLEIKDGSITIQ